VTRPAASTGGNQCVGYNQDYFFINNYGRRDSRICFAERCCPPFN
jgi:hypothetical protein